MNVKSLPALLVLLSACDDSSATQGTVQVFVEPEDTIPNGLEPGTEGDSIQDGWTVAYDKFIVLVGSFRASQSSGGTPLTAPTSYIVDLKGVPAGGFLLKTFTDVTATRWDKVGFDLPSATAAAEKPSFTAQADADRMKANGYSLYIEGTLTKPDGRSCRPTAPTDCAVATRIVFKWGLNAATSFDDCAPATGLAGFAVPAGGTVQVKPTIHGDHWFFTNVTQGAEITERRAQWVADADLDRDGETTLDELRRTAAADVFKASTYSLTGALIPIKTAFDYVEAQARTLGDFQGDGECPTRTRLP